MAEGMKFSIFSENSTLKSVDFFRFNGAESNIDFPCFLITFTNAFWAFVTGDNQVQLSDFNNFRPIRAVFADKFRAQFCRMAESLV